MVRAGAARASRPRRSVPSGGGANSQAAQEELRVFHVLCVRGEGGVAMILLGMLPLELELLKLDAKNQLCRLIVFHQNKALLPSKILLVPCCDH